MLVSASILLLAPCGFTPVRQVATLERVDGQLAEYFGVDEGVLVRGVEPNSSAGKAGLQAGDVIISISGEEVERPNEVRRALAKAGGDTAEVEVMRNRNRQTLELETGKRESARRPVRARSVSERR